MVFQCWKRSPEGQRERERQMSLGVQIASRFSLNTWQHVALFEKAPSRHKSASLKVGGFVKTQDPTSTVTHKKLSLSMLSTRNLPAHVLLEMNGCGYSTANRRQVTCERRSSAIGHGFELWPKAHAALTAWKHRMKIPRPREKKHAL